MFCDVFIWIFQLDYVQNLLQTLAEVPVFQAAEETTESSTSSVDEEDVLERAKLPGYTAKFKVRIRAKRF